MFRLTQVLFSLAAHKISVRELRHPSFEFLPMSAKTRLLFCLSLLFLSFSTYAQQAHRELSALIAQSQSLARQVPDQTLRQTEDLDQRTRLLQQATRLELQLESGVASLGASERWRLHQLIDTLEQMRVDVALLPARAVRANGTLSGIVSDVATGLPISTGGIFVQAVEYSSQLVPTGAGIVNNAPINASGAYSLSLPPGNYHLRTLGNSGYISHAHGFGDCLDSFYCPRYVGTIVTVPDGAAAPAVNFSVRQGGRISGSVQRADTSAVLPSSSIQAISENGFAFFSASTDASGNYTLNGLPAGRYRVLALPPPLSTDLLAELYNNIACTEFTCANLPGANLVTVTGTATTAGINFSLDVGTAALSGRITESGTSNPVVVGQTSQAILLAADRTQISVAIQSDGTFSFSRLQPGTYRLMASSPGYIAKAVSNLAPIATRDCADPTSCDLLDIGAPIVLGAGASTTGMDFALDRGASVSGTVRAASGATPLANVSVTVLNSTYSASATTDASGNYTVRGLPPGVYYAYAEAAGQNYVTTWLGDVACRGFFCFYSGVPITITTGASLTGRQFNMPTGGTITGVITDAASGFPAPRQTRLELFDLSGRLVVQQISSGISGYSATGLAPGAYKAVFASSSVLGWVDTAFGGLPCPRGGCDLSLLPSVFVTAGATTSGINVSLPRGAKISGRVFDAATGQPILASTSSGFSGTVALNNTLSNYAGFAQIDQAGNYLSRTGFPPGPYFLSSFLLRNNTPIGAGYIDQLYDNLSCPYGSCGLSSGTAINVAGVDIGGFNLALQRGGAISGTISNAAGATPLFGVRLKAFNSAGDLVAVASSNPNGNYLLRGLPPGSYFVYTENDLGFQDQLYTGQNCEPFCNPVTGTSITVTGTATTTGRNFSLQQSVSVSGTVSDGAAAANVPVEIYGQIGNLLRATVSDASGAYRFTDLAPGRFYVRSRSVTGRADDLYYVLGHPANTSPSKPNCVGLACQVRLGTPIDVAAGASFTGANLSLSAPAVIAGVVRNANTTAPLSGIALELLDARGAVVNRLNTDSAGAYSFTALSAGSYYLVSRNTPGFVDLAFPSSPCPSSCNGLNGTAISVAAGASSTGNNLALAAGGSISGTLRNSSNNLPIPGATVQVYNSAAVPVAQIATNASGNYELNNISDGNFFVRTQNGLGFVNEIYNNRACGGYCDLLNGDAVTIAGGALVGLIDFSLNAGGSISGRLSNSATSAGIALAEVQAIDVNGLIASRASTDASGNYQLGGLQPGTYKLRTSNTAGFVNQIYRSPTPLSCSPSPCLLAAGTPISVAGAVTGINLALSPGGTISGTAADLFNNPLPTGTAVLLDNNGIQITTVMVQNGLFEFNGLANGSYYVLIRNNSGLIDLLFPNVPCPAGACNITALGTPIVLSAARSANSNATASIDLRLPEGRSIAGRVTRSGAAMSGVTVSVYNSSGAVVATGVSDALGNWMIDGSLPAGAGISYFAATTGPQQRGAGGGLINEAWNNVPCMLSCNVSAVSTAIALPAAIAPLGGIDFDLAAGGAISGQVLSSLGGALSLVRVELYDGAGRLAGFGQSDSLGNYRIDGLVPGNYFARTVNVLGLQDLLFGGNTCGAGCNPLTGTAITVAGVATTPAINFSLPQNDLLLRNGFE